MKGFSLYESTLGGGQQNLQQFGGVLLFPSCIRMIIQIAYMLIEQTFTQVLKYQQGGYGVFM